MPDEVVRVVLPQPLAGKRYAEAVTDDVDALRPGVREHGVDERAQIRNVRDGRVRGAGPVGRRRDEIALVALVAEAPELARPIAVVEEVLRHRVHGSVRVAWRRERR